MPYVDEIYIGLQRKGVSVSVITTVACSSIFQRFYGSFRAVYLCPENISQGVKVRFTFSNIFTRSEYWSEVLRKSCSVLIITT